MRMRKRKTADPRAKPRMYMHDIRLRLGGGAAILSQVCTGIYCEICAQDPAAAKRANNPHYPHELGVEPPA